MHLLKAYKELTDILRIRRPSMINARIRVTIPMELKVKPRA